MEGDNCKNDRTEVSGHKVWELPLRVFHWCLVLSFAAALAASLSERLMAWHVGAGYAAGGLVVFRILWGLSGNRYARFSGFVRGPRDVVGYLRRFFASCPPRYAGHNPAVGWAVVLMLALVLAISATGLLTYGGEEGRGPFAGLVPFTVGTASHGVHELLAYTLGAVVLLHVTAALVHDLVFGERIIVSMITGSRDARGARDGLAAEPRSRPVLRRAALAVLAATIVAPLWYFPASALQGPSGVYRQPRITDESGAEVTIPALALWEAECGESCHGALHPTLLPAGSWSLVMEGLVEHFGDDASLDPEAVAEIEEYLVSVSAERSGSEASRKILKSMPGGAVPVRVTETPYWKDKHADIGEEVYARPSVVSSSNCAACHPGAVVGSFEDMDIAVPDK